MAELIQGEHRYSRPQAWQHRELGAQDEGPSNTLAPGPAPLSFAGVLKTVTFGTGQGLLLETIKRDSGSRFRNFGLLEIRRPPLKDL